MHLFLPKTDCKWEDLFKQSDPELWKFLTARVTLLCASKMIGNEMDNTALLKEKEMGLSSVFYPTEMHNIHDPNISSSGIVIFQFHFSQNQISTQFS